MTSFKVNPGFSIDNDEHVAITVSSVAYDRELISVLFDFTGGVHKVTIVPIAGGLSGSYQADLAKSALDWFDDNFFGKEDE
jgi:fatty acid-binding protein DegV